VADPLTTALRRTPLFDAGYYGRQVGVDFADDEAARRHYATHPDPAISPHPLFGPRWLYPGGRWRRHAPDPLSFYLRNPAEWATAPHPLLDAAALPQNSAMSPVEAWLVSSERSGPLPTLPGYLPVTLHQLRSVLLAPASYETRPRTAARTSVVVPVAGRLRPALNFLRKVRQAHDGDLEFLICLLGDSAELAFAAGVASALPVTGVLPIDDGSTWLDAARVGLAAASGDVTVLVRPEAQPGFWPWLDALAAAARRPAVGLAQPLLLDERFVVAAAGTSYDVEGRPSPLLAGFTDGDAARVREIPAVWPGVVAARTELWAGLGDDVAWAETTLSRSVGRSVPGAPTLVPGAWVRMSAPVKDGFAAGRRTDGLVATPGTSAAALADGATGLPSDLPADLAATSAAAWATADLDPTGRRLGRQTRWTIDIAAPGSAYAHHWGDYHFAKALAGALERHGQLVTIDSSDSRVRATRDREDVVLVLRGLDRVEPVSGAVNVLWVISHPELVTPEEAAGFDLVYAASLSWSTDRTREWGRPVEPLLQCTDPTRFHPEAAERRGSPLRNGPLGTIQGGKNVTDYPGGPDYPGVPDYPGPRLLFVGSSRGVRRPIVDLALATTSDPTKELQLWGVGWRELVDPSLVAGDFIPNDRLARAYGEAGVVLNDHWDDMRAAGFLSNRLFDAVASGARVVSDEVAGAEELFGGSVRTFRTPEEFQELVTEPFDRHFPDRAQRLVNAAEVASHHSFDERARQLVDAVHRGRKQPRTVG